jgi:predicted RND superfamily exporter protein
MRKRYLIPILLVVLLVVYGIGYGFGAASHDSKTVRLAGENMELMQENQELREALWEAQDIIIDIITSMPKSTSPSSADIERWSREYDRLEMESRLKELEYRMQDLEYQQWWEERLNQLE